MTDKMRFTANNVMEDISKTQNGTNLHSAVWFSVSPEFGLDYDYAFFKSYYEAKLWLDDKMKAKTPFCSEFYSYINGRVHDSLY